MQGQITPAGTEETWAGEIPVSDYSWSSAQARAYGTATVRLPRNHSVFTDAGFTSLRGMRLSIPHGLMGTWSGVQIGRSGRPGATWDQPCYQTAALFKQLTVPADPSVVYRNVPAGIIAHRALVQALALRPAIPLRPGAFAEAPPLVEAFTFQDQSLDAIFTQLMDLSGQEYQVDESGRVNWTAPAGTLYETVLTEGYDFVLLGYDETEDAPVGMVIVTDQRGEVQTAVAAEHALDVTSRVVRVRADTVGAIETRTVAEGLLAAGRQVPAVYEIGLLPAGGTIVITIPGSPGVLYGEGLYGEGIYGESGGFADLSADYPIVNAPHWEALREGDIVRLIVPSLEPQGEAPLCRVLSRTFGDAHPYPRIKLVSIPPWTLQTLQASRETHSGYSPPRTVERRMLEVLSSAGPAIDTARLRSQLEPHQVPVISDINGQATAEQVPDLDDLNGQLDPLTQANWTHDTTPPTATTTRYITVDLGGTQYKITAESVT